MSLPKWKKTRQHGAAAVRERTGSLLEAWVRSLTVAALCGVLLSPAPAPAESRGQAEMAFQGYYLGSDSGPIADISGIAFHFRNFFPGVGLLSGSVESYGREGGFQTGDNFLQMSGFTWGGLRWTVTGGDFRSSANLVDFPFYNVFYPEIAARGFKLEAGRRDRRYTFYYGGETLLEGPRVPFRVRVPQTAMGASVQQKIGTRLQLAARLLRLSSSPKSMEATPFFFPPNRDFRTVNSLALQSLYSLTSRLRIYAEATGSAVERTQRPSQGKETPVAAFVGPAWESPMLSVRANYAYQGATYLPVLGYFAGDRRGPFGEVRLRPFRRLELFGSANSYVNNLERNPELPTFRSTGSSAGTSATLPWKLTAITQLSTLHFSATGNDLRGMRESDNRQITASVGRPIHRHNLRVSARDLKLDSNLRLERQKSLEVEDVFQVKRFVVGAAVRDQRLMAEQRKDTLFFRGFVQASFRRLSAHAEIESGNDLVNRTVFATNTYSTTAFGVTAQLSRSWSLQAEAFRNRLTTELNPESIFVLENRGVGLSSALSGFNQWSLFFRLTKQLHWGGAMPAGSLEQYTAEQIPLVGEVSGFVFARLLDGQRPAAGIPVALDQSRTTSTDEAGRFRFIDVPDGPHKVSLAQAELPADYDPGTTVEASVLVKPKRVSRADLEVTPLASMEGNVAGPAGTSLENIMLLLPGDRYTTTDSDGHFAFQNLREGDYELVLDERSLPEHAVITTPARVSVSVRQGRAAAPTSFAIELVKQEKPVRRIFDQPLNEQQ